MALAASVSAQNSGTNCGTAVTLTNIYGQNGQFYLFVNDPTASPTTVISQNFTVAPANGVQTIALNVDQNSNPVSIRPGVTYSLKLETYGAGVCCGAFSNYTLALTGDLMFTNLSSLPSGATCSSATMCSGFLPPQIPGASNTFYFMVNTSGTSCPALFDPYPSLLANNVLGSALSFVQDPQALSTLGRQVSGISADGVTRAIIRIPASSAGQAFILTMYSDVKHQSVNPQQDGGLAAIGQAAANTQFSSVLSNVVAQNETINGAQVPVALAVFQSPLDFARAQDNFGNQNPDAAAASRNVYLQVTSGASSYFYSIDVVRPPVAFIHGLTADPSVWDNFTPLINNNQQFAIAKVDYSFPVGPVSSTSPTYPQLQWPPTGNVMGFAFNSYPVFNQLQNELIDFRSGALKATGLPVAGVQVDIVAHSMGGAISRTIPYEIASFYSFQNYFQGSIHKLITIGTPHQGSPIAIDVLNPNPDSECMASIQAAFDFAPYSSVTINGVAYTGGNFDLEGDGQGNSLSAALTRIHGPLYREIHMAALGGEYAPSQATTGFAVDARGNFMRAFCRKTGLSFVLENYSSVLWPNIMGGLAKNANGALWPVGSGPSDGIVPLPSALNLGTASSGVNVFPAIHGPGTTDLGFSDPTLLEPASGVPARVLSLLNEFVTGPDFVTVP
jgi:pimeloyl-ACP methyl ester carboxylesterase